MNNLANSRTLQRPSGHTLIELMVAIVIGLILVLAAFQVLAAFEGHKRSTTAMNDALASGNFGMYRLGSLARSAGTGLVQTGPYGCALNYTTSSGTVSNGVLPLTLAAPFAGITKLRLVPAIIYPTAGGSDVVMMMLGGAGFGEVPTAITQLLSTGNQMVVDSTVGFSANEWVLVGGTGGQCMITTIDPSYTSAVDNIVLTLSQSSVGAASLSSYVNGSVAGLGQNTAASFMAYGIDTTKNALVSVDLLNSDLTVQQASDDIVTLRAVYAVDNGAAAGSAPTGVITWTAPVAGVSIGAGTYNYSPAGLLAGTTAANTALRSIKAIRIAAIVRAPLSERTDASDTAISSSHSVNAGSYTLFSTLALATAVSWSVPTGQEGYRYRVLEGTIPLRNASF